MTDPERLPGRPQHPEDSGPDRPRNPDAPAHGAPASDAPAHGAPASDAPAHGAPASDAPTGPASDGRASDGPTGPASDGRASDGPASDAPAHGAPDAPGAPVPAPVPAEAPLPSGPGAMRASDTEREAVAERLREALAEGRLDMAEFDERLDAAYRAKTHSELVPLVRDLPAPTGGPAAPAHAPSVGWGAAERRDAGGWAARIGRPATSRTGVAVFGGFGRGGRWSVGRAFTAVAVMGGGDIDLRDADFEDREIVIRCFALMGGVSVVVPPDLDVEVSGFGLMGGFDDRATGPGTPGSPRVRITGLALMGGVEVKRKPRKGEKSRDSLEK
ncbi:DUF1707 domain-containing protein [Streptomyces fradiae]|uniref:DUF1707 domain-containing protein n=1 Tax=Streptomyces fradiae TaxID=1906 RepID=UPI003987E5ED